MTSPTGSGSGEPEGQSRARHPRRDEPSAEQARERPPQNVHPENYDYAETALGGADSVQKTSYVVGEGTEPAGAPRAGVIARTSSGGGINVGAWVIGLIALAIALVYGFGVFR